MKVSERVVLGSKIFFAIYMVAIVLLLVIYSSTHENRPVRFARAEWIEEWTVTDPDGNVFTAGSSFQGAGMSGGVYTMTTTLPETIRQGANLCMVIEGDALYYVGGVLRKSFDPDREFFLPGGIVKRFYILVPLYPEDSGKEVTFMRTNTTRRGFIYQDTLVTTATGLYAYLMAKYGLSFQLAELLFLFSGAIAIVSIALQVMYRRRIAMLYGAVSILVISGWLVTNSYLYPFVFNNYHIDGIVNYMICLLLPFNLVFYLDALQKGRYRKLVVGFLVVSVINCILWPLLHFTGIFNFANALLYIDFILALQVLFIMGLLCYETIRGYIREYRYTAIGVCGFLICAISEILILNFWPIMQDDIPMLLGLAVYMALTVTQQIHDLKQVREQGQRAVDLSEAKTQFLASMSHEIRTPINSVLGMNEMILRENTDPVIDEYARSVKTSGQMLLMLVNDVLDFSKIEAGKLEISKAPYRLSALLRSIMPILTERAKEKDLKIGTLILTDVPDGQISDEFRIRQVLINLANNAIKYTDEGSVTLMIGGEPMPDGKFMLRLGVKDTGRGISEEGQAHLFEAFTRADLKKNRSIEGTGLGLAIVKKILDSMGGEITVSSKVGVGSEFKVAIPVEVTDREPLGLDYMERGDAPVSSDGGCDYRAPSAKVLVVDDNASNLKLVQLLLKRAEITPETCDSGMKALEKCRVTHYDLILLDHMMPGMDGIETLEHIKNDDDSRNRAVPVVVLTANAVAGSREIYLEEGFADYLTKPIDTVLLEQTVKKYLPAERILPAEKKGNPAKKTEQTEQKQAEQKKKDPGNMTLRERIESFEGSDYETALRFVGGQEELLQTVTDTIVADAPENVEKLRAALSSENMDEYDCLAHAIKGQMATIGLKAFSERAKQHEFAAKDNKIDFLKEDSEKFFAEYLDLCDVLAGKS